MLPKLDELCRQLELAKEQGNAQKIGRIDIAIAWYLHNTLPMVAR